MDRVLGMEPRALDANIFGKEGKENGLEGIGEEKKGLFGGDGEGSKSREVFGGLLGKMKVDTEGEINGNGGSSSRGKEKAEEDVGMEEEL